MKSLHYLWLAAGLTLCALTAGAQTNTFPTTGSAGIGTTDPAPSSLLDMVSTSKGLLVPRMTKVQRDAIVSPATGLLIYQTNLNPGFFYYNGSSWTAISTQDASKTLNNLTTTAVNTTLQPGMDNTIDLGSGTFSWRNLYVDGVGYLNTVKVSNYAGTPEAGMIRWTGTEFQGYTGSSWISLSGGGGGGVSTDLSNLTTTAVNVDLNPGLNAVYDLGSTDDNWDNLYLNKTIYIDDISALAFPGYYDIPSISIGDTKFSGDEGQNNIYIGEFTAENATNTATRNVYIGSAAGRNSTSSVGNVFVGSDAGRSNSTGSNNVSIGQYAGSNATTGIENVLVGISAGSGITTGKKNVLIGAYTYADTEFGGIDSLNVILGHRAGSYNDGSGTVLIGAFAGHYNNKNGNVYVGNNAGFNATEGFDNVLIGDNAGYAQHDGYANTCIGARAGYNEGGIAGTASRYNVYIGTDAGYKSKGAYNTYIGSKCGDTYVDNEQCVLMGYGTDVSSSTITNAIAIGYFTSVSQSNSIRLGNSSISKIGIGKNTSAGSIMEFQATTAKLTTGGVWTDASDRKLKQNITELDKMEVLQKINDLSVTQWNYKADDPYIYHVGPMAQDFYAAFGLGDDTTIAAMDKAGIALIGIQALTDQLEAAKALNTTREEMVNALQQENADLKTRLEKLEQIVLGTNETSGQPASQTVVLSESQRAAYIAQNNPNPFTDRTVINYFVPTQSGTAYLLISDATGTEIARTMLSTGEGSIEIDATEISSGTLSYSLLVDGKIIATKIMIHTK